MKKILLALGIVYLSAFAAVAQHTHGNKGPNGGIMEDIAGVHAELTTNGNSIIFHITNEDGKPVATTNFIGSALVVSGSSRETITLTPKGENTLTGTLKGVITPSTQVTLQLKTDLKTGQARYKL